MKLDEFVELIYKFVLKIIVEEKCLIGDLGGFVICSDYMKVIIDNFGG